MPRHGPSYTEEAARRAIAESLCLSEALRRLGMCPTGGNFPILRKYARLWGIPTDHFDSAAARVAALRRRSRPLEEVLVESSTYSRGTLKRRLYESGLKQRRCELCGQGEVWHGRPIALILDHVNGVSDDNRIENLRIVCPNCAAALPTHCGRNVSMIEPRSCRRCGAVFRARTSRQNYCSKECGLHAPSPPGPRPERRKVERPPTDELLRAIEADGYRAVARRYGVSDNAIRKWLRAAGVEPPRRTGSSRPRGAATPPAAARRRGPGPGPAGPRRSR